MTPMTILETSLRFISEFGIFLFLISLCEQVLKTHQKHNIFWCVFVVFCIRKPPDFLNEGAISGMYRHQIFLAFIKFKRNILLIRSNTYRAVVKFGLRGLLSEPVLFVYFDLLGFFRQNNHHYEIWLVKSLWNS